MKFVREIVGLQLHARPRLRPESQWRRGDAGMAPHGRRSLSWQKLQGGRVQWAKEFVLWDKKPVLAGPTGKRVGLGRPGVGGCNSGRVQGAKAPSWRRQGGRVQGRKLKFYRTECASVGSPARSRCWSVELPDQGLHRPKMAIGQILVALFAGRHGFLGGVKALNDL